MLICALSFPYFILVIQRRRAPHSSVVFHSASTASTQVPMPLAANPAPTLLYLIRLSLPDSLGCTVKVKPPHQSSSGAVLLAQLPPCGTSILCARGKCSGNNGPSLLTRTPSGFLEVPISMPR